MTLGQATLGLAATTADAVNQLTDNYALFQQYYLEQQATAQLSGAQVSQQLCSVTENSLDQQAQRTVTEGASQIAGAAASPVVVGSNELYNRYGGPDAQLSALNEKSGAITDALSTLEGKTGTANQFIGGAGDGSAIDQTKLAKFKVGDLADFSPSEIATYKNFVTNGEVKSVQRNLRYARKQAQTQTSSLQNNISNRSQQVQMIGQSMQGLSTGSGSVIGAQNIQTQKEYDRTKPVLDYLTTAWQQVHSQAQTAYQTASDSKRSIISLDDALSRADAGIAG